VDVLVMTSLERMASGVSKAARWRAVEAEVVVVEGREAYVEGGRVW
jgi:hypothetical protein